MKSLSQTSQFAKDVKRVRKRGKDISKLEISKLEQIVRMLAHDQPLEPRPSFARPWSDSRDCHIELIGY